MSSTRCSNCGSEFHDDMDLLRKEKGQFVSYEYIDECMNCSEPERKQGENPWL